MSQQQLVIDLLVKWRQARELGEEPTAEELCRECPELLPILRARMEQLARIRWLEDRDEEASIDDGLSLPSLSGVSPRETGVMRPREVIALSELSMSAMEFQQTLTEAGLLSALELSAIPRRLRVNSSALACSRRSRCR
jgi:hypothetical protein